MLSFPKVATALECPQGMTQVTQLIIRYWGEPAVWCLKLSYTDLFAFAAWVTWILDMNCRIVWCKVNYASPAGPWSECTLVISSHQDISLTPSRKQASCNCHIYTVTHLLSNCLKLKDRKSEHHICSLQVLYYFLHALGPLQRIDYTKTWQTL